MELAENNIPHPRIKSGAGSNPLPSEGRENKKKLPSFPVRGFQSPSPREERVGVRRKLRNQSTPTEQIVWQKIRSRQLNGLKFRRQHSFGRYVVDFYCPEKELVVEIDGDIHDLEQNRKHDKVREEYLKSLDLKVIHVTTHEVRENLSGVLERLTEI